MTDSERSVPSVDHIPFARLLDIRLTTLQPDLVRAELVVRPELCTSSGRMHGGAVMAFADTLGAVGASKNLPAGANGTTTTESKTNFLSGAPTGETVIGEATPVKIGRRLSVWQTRITTTDGKLVALVTQSQMVL